MLFKVYYCDSSVKADEVYQVWLKEGYKTAVCYCDDGVTFDIFPNKMDYTRNRIVINDADGHELLNESFRFWRNYLVIFEDKTIIALRRDFDPGEHSKRNRDKMDEFINAIREKINQSNAVIIQDDDDDFVV